MNLRTLLEEGSPGQESVVLVNTLEGPYGPKIIPYGDISPVVTLGNSFHHADPSGSIHDELAEYERLQERIIGDFVDRGEEIVTALDEAVMNYAKYRNGLDEQRLLWLKQFPEQAAIHKKVKVWPWRSIAHLCFAVNADGPPDYDFDPNSVKLSPLDRHGKVRMGSGGRGHIIMASYSNLLAYDGEKGLYLFFNLPEEHWLTE